MTKAFAKILSAKFLCQVNHEPFSRQNFQQGETGVYVTRPAKTGHVGTSAQTTVCKFESE